MCVPRGLAGHARVGVCRRNARVPSAAPCKALPGAATAQTRPHPVRVRKQGMPLMSSFRKLEK